MQKELGVDILDYFTGERSWHEFYDYIQELPPHGKFHSAMAMDEDFAKMLKARLDRNKKDWDEEPDEGAPLRALRSPEGFTPSYQMLLALDEHVQALIRITISMHSKSKPPEINQHARPFTAYDNLELYSQRTNTQRLAAKFGIGNGSR